MFGVTGTRKRSRISLGLPALAALLLLAGYVGQSAQARTSVAFDPLDFTVTICNGDLVHITGTEVTAFSNTLTSAHAQDLRGVDLTTGTVYHGQNTFFDINVPTPPGGGIETFSQDIRLVAAGGQSFTATGVFHATVTPDGTLQVFFVHASSSC